MNGVSGNAGTFATLYKRRGLSILKGSSHDGQPWPSGSPSDASKRGFDLGVGGGGGINFERGEIAP